MLITLKEILSPALYNNSIIGAFNATCYGDAQPIFTAAEKLHAPVIIQIGPSATSYMDIGLWGKILIEMASRATIPVCLHFDHGKRIIDVQSALDAGFTGVMIDGSQLTYKENVELTRKVVKRAEKYGVSVEAEIGSVAYHGVEGISSILSDPVTVENFVNDTGVDAVAVAVGTTHRMEKKSSHIDFDRLRSIEERIGTPLVIHGSSGLIDEDILKLRSTKVCKLNIGTALRMCFNNAFRKALEDNPSKYVLTELVTEPMLAVESLVSEKLRLLGF